MIISFCLVVIYSWKIYGYSGVNTCICALVIRRPKFSMSVVISNYVLSIIYQAVAISRDVLTDRLLTAGDDGNNVRKVIRIVSGQLSFWFLGMYYIKIFVSSIQVSKPTSWYPIFFTNVYMFFKYKNSIEHGSLYSKHNEQQQNKNIKREIW